MDILNEYFISKKRNTQRELEDDKMGLVEMLDDILGLEKEKNHKERQESK